MLKKIAALLLATFIVCGGSGYTVFGQTQRSGDAESLRKLKVKVAKIYSQRRGKIKVKYNDGTRLKGYLTEVKDDTFSVTDSKTGKSVVVPYEQVSRIDRNDLPTAGKILIATGATLGIIVLVSAIAISAGLD